MVSNFGNIKSKERTNITKQISLLKSRVVPERLLKQSTSVWGYKRIGFRANGNKYNKNYQVHRLVATAFLDNPNHLPQVNHIDGNKTNNYASNLEWCTASENAIHAFKVGLKKGKKGEDSPQSFLKEKDILDIRLRKSLGEKAKDIALSYGITGHGVRDITNRRRWKHI